MLFTGCQNAVQGARMSWLILTPTKYKISDVHHGVTLFMHEVVHSSMQTDCISTPLLPFLSIPPPLNPHRPLLEASQG